MMFKELLILCGFITLILNIYWFTLLLANRSLLSNEPRRFAKKFVSIIVPAFNEELIIERCISSLLSLDYPKSLFEIIVVDDGSVDRTFELVSKFKSANIRLFKLDVNSGKKSVPLNFALKHLNKNSEAVVVLDADSIVVPGILKQVLPFFEEDSIGAVSVRYMPLNRNCLLAKLQVFEYFYSILWRKLLSLIDSMDVTPGVFSTFRRSVLENVGGFNENTLTEDMEIALRIQKAGYKIAYCFGAKAFTEVPTQLKQYFRQRVRWQRGYLQSIFMHRDLIFSRKAGNFGMIMLPINLLSLLIVFLASSLLLLTFIKYFFRLLKFFYKSYLINFDLSVFLAQALDFSFENLFIDFRSFISGFDIFSFIFIFSVMLSFILFFTVRYYVKEPLGKDSFYYPIFLFIYLPLYSLIWLYSIISQVLGLKRSW